jgi:hypothetical protein
VTGFAVVGKDVKAESPMEHDQAKRWVWLGSVNFTGSPMARLEGVFERSARS